MNWLNPLILSALNNNSLIIKTH